jgi:hypothetical protein
MNRALRRRCGNRATLPFGDHILAHDRAYFAAHPEATSYVRRAMRSEALIAPSGFVYVRQLGPGLRARMDAFAVPRLHS